MATSASIMTSKSRTERDETMRVGFIGSDAGAERCNTIASLSWPGSAAGGWLSSTAPLHQRTQTCIGAVQLYHKAGFMEMTSLIRHPMQHRMFISVEILKMPFIVSDRVV
jgi:hypothetical protein